MKTITINILDTNDIEKITADTVSIDNPTATHYNNVVNLIDVLTAEKKAMDKALLDKLNHKTFKNDMIATSVYDSFILDTDALIEDIGKDKYDEHKTKVRHTEKVTRFGK